ncbi:hypothetical protein V865_002806 [Kwoniella europaea PYCC6329]|uniref:Uncharacterized protein n=1 Tax=Kwoniella europaea PYCC6329 TaxID=1423913 RepID=A0AAX4KGU2_9TREE
MITYAPKTFTVSRLTSLCRQSQSIATQGLSSSQPTKEVYNQPSVTIKTFSYRAHLTEGVLRNKIEKARLAHLKRHGKI